MAFQEFQSYASSMPDASESHEQPQQQQLPRSQPQPARAGLNQQQAPAMVPLSLELVPPVLCQSFGVPMHDSQFVQRNMLGYGVSNAIRNTRDLFRFGHAEQYGAGQSFIADPSQIPYSAGQLTSLGPMGPLMYGLQGADAVSFAQAQHAHYANSMLQCNAAFSAQQQQRQHQNQQCQSQSALDGKAPSSQASLASTPGSQQFHCPQGVSLPRSGYVDPSLFQHALVQPMDGRAELREEEMRGLKRAPSACGIHPGFGPRGAYMEPVKRSRLVWTPELHQRFEEAVLKAGGIDVAVPKTVLEHMAVPGLTRDNVASHLQKHRMHAKKTKGTPSCRATENTQTNSPCATLSGTEDGKANSFRSGVADGVQAAEAGPQSELEAQTIAKGAASASYVRTSDTSGISRRTAFTCAIGSIVNSAPESRETIMAHSCGPTDNGPAASNIASSTRINGSNGSNGNGSSTADGNGLASNEGNQGSAQGANGVSSAAPPACMRAEGMCHDGGSAAGNCQTPIAQAAGS